MSYLIYLSNDTAGPHDYFHSYYKKWGELKRFLICYNFYWRMDWNYHLGVLAIGVGEAEDLEWGLHYYTESKEDGDIIKALWQVVGKYATKAKKISKAPYNKDEERRCLKLKKYMTKVFAAVDGIESITYLKKHLF